MRSAGTFRIWVLALCCWLALLPAARAQEEAGAALEDARPVSLEADEFRYDRETDTYRASGAVRLQRDGLTLLADEVVWHAASGDAEAEGRVRVELAEDVMEGEALRLNLESGTGVLTRGKVFARERNYHLVGETIERLGEQDYRVTGGTFTTCDGAPPAWKFGARRLDVTLGNYARAKHVFFYLRDIPVLYIPYLVYPVKTERESGFLLPRLGYSEKRGVEASLAYYQVLGRNMDATLYLDYLSDLGVGKGLEYRYIFGEDNDGVARGYHINGLRGEDNRYAFSWEHTGTLPGKVRLAADAEYVSDRDYFEDFGEVAEEYNKDKAQSVLFLSRSWGRNNLAGQLKYTKDLENDNDQTLQRLPEIAFTVPRRRLGDTPFFVRLDASSTHFWRREGLKGERLAARPALAATFFPGRLITLEPEAGYRERIYWTSDEGPGYEREGIVDLSTRLSTRLSRVFHVAGKVVKKIRHSIDPEVVYRYIPSENQDHLPFFDVLDRIGPENKIAYSLTNRLTARLEQEGGEPVYHEFLYLRLSQDYDIRESRRDLLFPEDRRRPFSTIRGELVVRPTRQSFLDVDARYDVNSGEDNVTDKFVAVNARAGVRDGAGNGLALDYRYRRDDLEYLSGRLDLAWLRPFYVNYQHRYDFADQRTLEKVLNLEYRAQCWSIFLTLRDRLQDTEYLVTFALTGLGKVAQFGGSLGSSEAE